jgi:hypothetical protein
MRCSSSSSSGIGSMPSRRRARSSTRDRRRLENRMLRAMPISHADAGASSPTVLARCRERDREGLGGEVGGQLRIARTAHEVAEHEPLVALIEGAERRGVAAGAGEQLIVVGHGPY